jgi:IclR family mhp operon transcriptional activator
VSKERTRYGQPRQAEGVRAFKRGLDVLHEVNRSGGIRAGDLARQLDLPRPTSIACLKRLKSSAMSRAARATTASESRGEP